MCLCFEFKGCKARQVAVRQRAYYIHWVYYIWLQHFYSLKIFYLLKRQTSINYFIWNPQKFRNTDFSLKPIVPANELSLYVQLQRYQCLCML